MARAAKAETPQPACEAKAAIGCGDDAGICVDEIVRDVYPLAGSGEGWRPCAEELAIESVL